MKKILIALSLLFCTVSVSAQINDTATLRGYINSTIVPNTSKSITAQMLSNILNGNLNVLPNLLGRYYDSIWVSGGNLYLRRKGVTTNVSISAVEADPVWAAAAANYWLGTRVADSIASVRNLANTRITKSDADTYYPSISRTLDSLAALRSANAAKLNITDAASTYPTITRFNDTATAIQDRIQTKEPLIAAGTIGQYWRGDKSWQTLDKTAVGLGNVDNTSDANKPISTATQTALDGKVPTSRTINGYALTSNITLNKSDVGLSNVPNTDATNATNITSGTLPDARLSANVTVQGNSFNSANQLVKLDAGGKLPSSTIPSLALVETFVVGSQAAMLALSAQMGDVAVRTDNNRSYILQSEPATTLSNWVQLLVPDSETDPVYTASSWFSTTNNASNWNTAYSWGNHATQGYITNSTSGLTNYYTQTQIQNFFSGASAITGYNYSNWNTAYGWGNHASAGYALTSGSYSNPSWITSLAWSKLTGVPSLITGTGTSGYVPVWNGSSDQGNSSIRADANNAAIGGVQGSYKFRVYGNALFDNEIYASGVLSSGYGPSGNGSPINFKNWANATIGSINTTNGNASFDGTVTSGGRTRLAGGYISDAPSTGNNIGIAFGSSGILSTDGDGNLSSKDLGSSTYKWRDIYAGSISVSGVYNKAAQFNGGFFGNSGGDYHTHGYNVGFTSSGSTWNYVFTDYASFIRYHVGGFQFWTAPSGTGGTSMSPTKVLEIFQAGNATMAGVMTAGSFYGSGEGLTGTASSLTAGAVTNGVYTNTSQTISGEKTFSSTYTYVNTLRASGDVIAYYTSDRRLKKNIKPIENALEKLCRLSGNEYDWDEAIQNTYKGHDYGVIAQEIESVLPGTTHLKPDGFFGIKNQNQIMALLIQAVKELKNEVDQLKKR